MPTPQEIIRAKREKENPALGVYRMMQEFQDKIEAALDKKMDDMRKETAEMIKNATAETKGRAKIEINGAASTIQGPKGEKGDVGPEGKSIVGAQGPKGEKGDHVAGPQGSQGPRGFMGPSGPQGVPGPRGKDGRPGLKGDPGNDGAPDSPADIARKFLLAVKNGLITLPDTSTLAKQLRGEINVVARQNKITHGGGMKLKAGAGQTIVRNSDGTYTLTTSGNSLSLLTATGSIDASNKAFTFVSKPTIIIVNGATYRENNGWAWNSGTLTATLDGAVGVGGDIYGLG